MDRMVAKLTLFLFIVSVSLSSLCLGGQSRHRITLEDRVLAWNNGMRARACFKIYIKDQYDNTSIVKVNKIRIDRIGMYYLSKDLVCGKGK